MQKTRYHPAYAEEKLIWFGLVCTYPVYLFGGLYVTGSILGWLILLVVCCRRYIDLRQQSPKIPPLAWLWVGCMSGMLVVLWVGHANWELGTLKTIKSSIGWAKGWALIALFIVIGAIAPIKKELLIRGVCIISCHSFIFAIITLTAYIVGLPGEIYISPLKIVGGPGPNFFTVSMYGLNPETGAGRWQFFGPWAPAAGLLSCIYLVICLQEKDKFWRIFGVLGCLAMCLLSQSRAGWLVFVLIWPMVYSFDKLREPWFLLMLGVLLPLVLILGQPLFEWLLATQQQIKDARPESTRVRASLANIAIQRWQAEAWYFGHGIVERGPDIVKGMPIGTHHTWYGLLFVKGFLGFALLALPMLISAVYLLWQAFFRKIAHCALCLMAVMICYSFFENLEVLSYLYWPALLLIGMALNPAKR